MADHIATRKSTQISASTNRNARTDRLIVNGSQQRVNVYSKPVTYGAMNNQKQAEPCVLYIRVSTTRQADKGVSLKAQKERGILHAEVRAGQDPRDLRLLQLSVGTASQEALCSFLADVG